MKQSIITTFTQLMKQSFRIEQLDGTAVIAFFAINDGSEIAEILIVLYHLLGFLR
ncbi:hypothetical protein [Enterococcus sp. LJL99]